MAEKPESIFSICSQVKCSGVSSADFVPRRFQSSQSFCSNQRSSRYQLHSSFSGTSCSSSRNFLSHPARGGTAFFVSDALTPIFIAELSLRFIVAPSRLTYLKHTGSTSLSCFRTNMCSQGRETVAGSTLVRPSSGPGSRPRGA